MDHVEEKIIWDNSDFRPAEFPWIVERNGEFYRAYTSLRHAVERHPEAKVERRSYTAFCLSIAAMVEGRLVA